MGNFDAQERLQRESGIRRMSDFKLRLSKDGRHAILTLSVEDMDQVLTSAREMTGCWNPDDEFTDYFEELMDNSRKKLDKLIQKRDSQPIKLKPVKELTEQQENQAYFERWEGC